jgi:hypothetical protein
LDTAIDIAVIVTKEITPSHHTRFTQYESVGFDSNKTKAVLQHHVTVRHLKQATGPPTREDGFHTHPTDPVS